MERGRMGHKELEEVLGKREWANQEEIEYFSS